MYHQSLEHALPAPVWQRWESSIRWWFSYPGIRAWWAAKPAPLTADFERFVDGILAEGPLDEDSLSGWNRFVAGEGLPASPNGHR